MTSTENQSTRLEMLPMGLAMGCAAAAGILAQDAIDSWLLRPIVAGLVAGITAYITYRAASTAARLLRTSQ
jgi:phosphate/sulfate permease